MGNYCVKRKKDNGTLKRGREIVENGVTVEKSGISKKIFNSSVFSHFNVNTVIRNYTFTYFHKFNHRSKPMPDKEEIKREPMDSSSLSCTKTDLTQNPLPDRLNLDGNHVISQSSVARFDTLD